MLPPAGRFELLLQTPSFWVLVGLAAVLVLLYRWGRRDGVVWVPLGMRVVAVLGLIFPAWTILDWYRDLSRVEEWGQALPVDATAIADRFLTNSMALMFLGFLVMVGGIYLARRIPDGRKGNATDEHL